MHVHTFICIHIHMYIHTYRHTQALLQSCTFSIMMIIRAVMLSGRIRASRRGTEDVARHNTDKEPRVRREGRGT